MDDLLKHGERLYFGLIATTAFLIFVIGTILAPMEVFTFVGGVVGLAVVSYVVGFVLLELYGVIHG
jgi:hypothetical protein